MPRKGWRNGGPVQGPVGKMSKKNKQKNTHKTNAVRIVEAEGIEYQMHEYDAPEGFLDGVSVVTVGASRQNYVCVIPVAEELDLKKAAKYFGEKKIEMLPSKLITQTTGYIKGGCSPVGMKKPFPTAVDLRAADLDTIMVSGGKVGLQMQLPAAELLRITGAQLADLIVDRQK